MNSGPKQAQPPEQTIAPAKAAEPQTPVQKERFKRTKAAGKWVKARLVSKHETIFGMSFESRDLCDRLRAGLGGLKERKDERSITRLMEYVYDYQINSKGLAKSEASNLTELMKKLYTMLPQKAQLEGTARPVAYIRTMYVYTAAQAGQNPLSIIGLLKGRMDETEILGLARIVGRNEAGSVEKISSAFGTKLSIPYSAKLQLELFAKQVQGVNIVNSYNETLDAVGKTLRSLYKQGDVPSAVLLEEMHRKIQSGKVKSVHEAVAEALRNPATRKKIQDSLEKELKQKFDVIIFDAKLAGEKNIKKATTGPALESASRKARNEIKKIMDTREKYKSQLSSLLDNLAAAGDQAALKKAAGARAPEQARHMLYAIRKMSGHVPLAEQIEARHILSSTVLELVEKAETGGRQLAASARPVGGLFETLGGKVQRRVARIGEHLRGDIRAAREIGEIRPRKLISASKRALLPMAAAGVAGYAVYWYFWGRTTAEQEKARELLQNAWGVNLPRDTFRQMHSSETSKKFFAETLASNHPKALGVFTPENESALYKLLAEKRFVVNPSRISDLANEVAAHIRSLEKQGKTPAQIEKSLDDMVKGAKGDWREKGYFLTPGEMYVEDFSKQLNLNREITYYLKQNRNFLTLLWAGIRDGSLPRAFTSDMSRAIFSDKPKLAKLGAVVRERAATPLSKMPSVHDSMASAGLNFPGYLLENPIPQGSLMDVYDQWATDNRAKWGAAFSQAVRLYNRDENARERLQAFRLRDNEAVYGNIDSLANAVAQGRYDYTRAKNERIVASDIFERLRVFDRNIVKFAYEYSGEAGGSGIVRWLEANAARLGPVKQENAKKMLQYFMRSERLLIGKSPSEIEKLLSGKETLERFRQEGWYVPTTMPFMGPSVRDTVPRLSDIELPPKTAIEAPQDAQKLWKSRGIEALKEMAYLISEEKVVRGSLARNADAAKRILGELKAIQPKGRQEQRAKAQLISTFQSNDEAGVRALRKRSAAYKMLTQAIRSDLESQAPKIFNDFFVAIQKREKEFGLSISASNKTAESVKIEDYSKLAKLQKELLSYFRLYYSGR